MARHGGAWLFTAGEARLGEAWRGAEWRGSAGNINERNLMSRRGSITIGLTIDEEREFRKVLIDQGKSISEWGRAKVREEIMKARAAEKTVKPQ